MSQRVVQWVVEVWRCVSEPESGSVGHGGVWHGCVSESESGSVGRGGV